MRDDEPENLWLYGEMEPWRRGRIILLNITIFYAVLQALVFAATLLVGAVEVAMGFALTLVIGGYSLPSSGSGRTGCVGYLALGDSVSASPTSSGASAINL